MTRIKFVTRVARMGDKRFLNIPKELHSRFARFKDVDLRVTVDDEIFGNTNKEVSA